MEPIEPEAQACMHMSAELSRVRAGRGRADARQWTSPGAQAVDRRASTEGWALAAGDGR